MKLSILMPCFNEIRTIKTILETVSNVQLETDKEIIIIDDCSTDGTIEFLKSIDGKQDYIKIIYHNENRWKGAAIKTGLGASSGDIIIIQDADLEYDPREYPKLLKPILENKADVVYGSRFIGG